MIATDVHAGKELWRVSIFTVEIQSGLEEDVQWVFITNLKLFGNGLLIWDEKDRCYRLDLRTKEAKQVGCTSHETPDLKPGHSGEQKEGNRERREESS